MGPEWIVQRIEEQGIQRQLTLRAASGAVVRSQMVEPPGGESSRRQFRQKPFGTIIDGPVLDHLEGLATFVAVRGDPWSGPVAIKLGDGCRDFGRGVSGVSTGGDRAIANNVERRSTRTMG